MVTITAATSRTKISDGRPAAGRVFVALVTVIVGIVVAFMSFLAAPASAALSSHAGNGVGVIAHPGGQRVGSYEPILAGRHRQRSSGYDQTVVGSGVGAETAGAGGPLEIHPFSSGASHLTTTEQLARFPGSPTFGGPDGLFVAPSDQIDALVARSKSTTELEQALGLPPGQLSGGDLVRIDVGNPFERNLRLPDPAMGNAFHLPGAGFTNGLINEGVIDSPLRTDPNVVSSILSGWGE
jgi:hypothetical protein